MDLRSFIPMGSFASGMQISRDEGAGASGAQRESVGETTVSDLMSYR